MTATTTKNTLYAKILFYFWWILVMLIPGQTSAQVYADSQTNGADMTCVGCYAKDPQHATDGNTLSYGTLNLMGSVSPGFVYQNLQFSSPGTSGNYIGVVVEDPGLAALNTALLTGVSLTTYYNNISNQDTRSISHVSIIPVAGSATKYALEFQAGQAFDNVRLQLTGGQEGIIRRLRIYYAYRSGTAMPADLLSFAAMQNQKEVVIDWNTETQFSNKSFAIENNSDGSNFTVFGTVEGAGTTDLMDRYFFADRKPVPGTCYYRATQTDLNEKSKVHSAILSGYTSKEERKIFSGPAVNKTIKVRLNNTEPGDLSIYDEEGLLVFSDEYTSEDALASQEIACVLPAGVFYVGLVTASTTEVKKVIVLE